MNLPKESLGAADAIRYLGILMILSILSGQRRHSSVRDQFTQERESKLLFSKYLGLPGFTA